MNYCSFTLGKSSRRVHAGPYRDRPTTHLGVKMAEEIKSPCDISIPTEDFSVPTQQMMEEGIRQVLKPLALGEPIYVGCMGGIGRTGLFLACLAKTLGAHRPVHYVRSHYEPHAVETRQQRDFVEEFNELKFNRLLPRYRFAARVVDLMPWSKGLVAKLLT